MTTEVTAGPAGLLVLAGPHGVGKDAILAGILDQAPWAVRVVRLTTREPGPREVDGVDYRFVSPAAFEFERASGTLLAVGIYLEASTAIRWSELTSISPARVGLVSMNLDDAPRFKDQCEALGVPCVTAFVSPVERSIFEASEQSYLDVLAKRMLTRGRPTDDVPLRLAAARRYRLQVLAEPNHFRFVTNTEGQVETAIANCRAIASELRRPTAVHSTEGASW